MAHKTVVAFAIALFASSVTRAEPPAEEVIQFYQSLKKAPTEIEAAGLVFGEKLREAISMGNSDNVAQMKIALMDVLLTLHRIKSESKLLKIIPSPSGKELYTTIEYYLKQQEKTILDSGPEIIRVAADGTLTSADKKTKIQALIDVNRKGAAAVQPAFTKALMAFARDHDLIGEPTVEFHEFTLPDKSCKVQMPDLTENKTNESDGVKNSYYLAEHKYGIFMLSYADIASAGEGDPALQKRLDEARTGVQKKLNLKLTKETMITLANKYPGRELEGDLPDKSITRIRLFIVNGRLYQLWIIGSPAWAVTAEATRFLTSLELLN